MEPKQAMAFITNILSEVTMVNKAGRESGLTLNDRASIQNALKVIDDAISTASKQEG